MIKWLQWSHTLMQLWSCDVHILWRYAGQLWLTNHAVTNCNIFITVNQKQDIYITKTITVLNSYYPPDKLLSYAALWRSGTFFCFQYPKMEKKNFFENLCVCGGGGAAQICEGLTYGLTQLPAMCLEQLSHGMPKQRALSSIKKTQWLKYQLM